MTDEPGSRLQDLIVKWAIHDRSVICNCVNDTCRCGVQTIFDGLESTVVSCVLGMMVVLIQQLILQTLDLKKHDHGHMDVSTPLLTAHRRGRCMLVWRS